MLISYENKLLIFEEEISLIANVIVIHRDEERDKAILIKQSER